MSRGRPEKIENAVRRAVKEGKTVITTGGSKPTKVHISVRVERDEAKKRLSKNIRRWKSKKARKK